jgi:O-antigen biosynthesis protein
VPADAGERTPGGLPLAPFRHDEPTAMALLDLDRGLAATATPAGAAAEPCRDTLLLVRLHGQPLDVVHLDRPLAGLPRAELCELLWSRLSGALREHVARAGCAAPPTSAADIARWDDDAAHRAASGAASGATDCAARDTAAPHGAVAVIVPTGGRPAQLRRCLAALAEQTGPPCEVVVVDNQPDLRETRLVVEGAAAASRHHVRYVAEPRPGSSVARNRGVAQATAGIVAFTDDDVVVERDWLRLLVAPFACAEVGATTGLVLPLELATPAQKRFEQYSGFAKGLRRSGFDLHRDRADHRLLYPFWGGVFGSGNSMAFRREALVAAGGFDPALGAGSRALAGADIDALSAVVLRGARLVYEPRSLCWHEHRRDDEALRRQVFNYGVGFTAILTKALLHDRRFATAAARSVPVAWTLRRARPAQGRDPAATAAPELARLERRGMLRGPARYLDSVVWSHRLGLQRVIDGG